jgi:hypothetical protein
LKSNNLENSILIKMPTSGYSGTPLLKKLGIKEGFVCKIIQSPYNYIELFESFPQNIVINPPQSGNFDFIHYFTKSAEQLLIDIHYLRNAIRQNGMIWISWPKKASGRKSDLTEDLIRSVALSNGLVDVKVCAVDDIWSALKLVIPVKERKK